MKFIFDYVKNIFYGQNPQKLKTGDMVYIYSNRKSSQRTRAIIKIYGKRGFVVSDNSVGSLNYSGKPAVKLISRNFIRKFCREDKKIKRKIWVGLVPVEEISWVQKIDLTNSCLVIIL